MSGKVVGPEGLSIALQDILGDIPETLLEEQYQAAKEAAEQCCRDIKRNSAKRTGKYRRGWKVDVKIDESAGTVEATVHNAKMPQLTHLLENPHVIANQRGTYGMTSGDHVIADAFRNAARGYGDGR